MRRTIIFNQQARAENPELWAAVLEVVIEVQPTNPIRILGREYQPGEMTQDLILQGMLEVTANLDDDLTSEDDYISFELNETSLGAKVQKAARLLGLAPDQLENKSQEDDADNKASGD